MRLPPVRAVRRSELLVVAILAAALSVAACSGDDAGPAATPPSGGSQASTATDNNPPPPLATTATVGQVRGQLPQGKRGKVRDQVQHAVDAWFDAAYVGGDYPRTDYSDSWPSFTPGARADAEDDKSLMSNVDLGRVVDDVEATTRKVSVDVLAVKGHAQGATARFVLRFRTSGERQEKVQVRGRLFLTPSPDGWRIFGYDVTKGAIA